MHCIMIEKVQNGWLVRPFNPTPNWGQCCSTEDSRCLFVYTSMADLQADLPRLMTAPLIPSNGTTVANG